MTPADSGAVYPVLIVQARTSFTPAVKYVCKFNREYVSLIIKFSPGSATFNSDKKSCFSSSVRSAISDSILAHTGIHLDP